MKLGNRYALHSYWKWVSRAESRILNKTKRKLVTKTADEFYVHNFFTNCRVFEPRWYTGVYQRRMKTVETFRSILYKMQGDFYHRCLLFDSRYSS